MYLALVCMQAAVYMHDKKYAKIQGVCIDIGVLEIYEVKYIY